MVQKRILFIAFTAVALFSFFNWNCTKLDTTTIGSDLLPAVDNVHTFADTLFVNAQQRDFNDTSIITYLDNQVLGNINNDPLFGKTTANMFLQLKPSSFPFSFGNPDSLAGYGLDSVVLCLSYKYFWGDSTMPQKLQVFEVTDTRFRDSANKNWDVNTQPNTGASISPVKNIDIRRLGDYMKYAWRSDSVNNQIRIKLDASYASTLFNSDSASSGPGNHAFYNDSLYRNSFLGIAIKGVGTGPENALLYINVADTNTKLEVHYRIRNAGHIDTTYRSFKFSTAFPYPSSSANYVMHDRAGSPSAFPPSTEIYLQAQPGTYASLVFPELTGYSNRIIHRAELLMEEIPDNPYYDTAFSAPNFLYMDLKVPGSATPALYKPLYIDLNTNAAYDPDFIKAGYSFYPTGGVDFVYFGGYLRRKSTSGGDVNYYNLNITRYVQQMVTNQNTNYEMRLMAPFSFHYPQYSLEYINYNNSPAYGRIKLGSGTHPLHRMRLRIIYSKL